MKGTRRCTVVDRYSLLSLIVSTSKQFDSLRWYLLIIYCIMLLVKLCCLFLFLIDSPCLSFTYSTSSVRRYGSFKLVKQTKNYRKGNYQMASTLSYSEGDKKSAAPDSGSTQLSSLRTSSTNLIKNCVGAGVFSITSRITSISPDVGTLYKGMAVILLMAAWATYNFWILGETCAITKSSTYSESWAKTISKSSVWIVQLVVILSPIVSCLANTIVLTDILGILLRNIGFPLWLYGNRNTVILLLGSLILFPICSLKNLNALRSVSVFGLLGQLVAMGALGVRLLDKSYFAGGKFFVDSVNPILASTAVALTPVVPVAASAAAAVDPMKWFVFSSLLSYCFVTHYNAPRFFTELENRNSSRFLKMSGISFFSAGLVYILTMSLGFALFGAGSKSFLLNNLAAVDPLALVARLCFGASVLASYPLIFLAMRNWFVTVASQHAPSLASIWKVTLLLLTLICTLATKFTDIGVVGSLAGGIFGTSMMFIFPPIMYISALHMKAKDEKATPNKGVILMNAILMVFGTVLGVFGTSNTILSILKK